MLRHQQLRMARAGLGWTLQELAERAGVNPNTISRFEGGAQILSGKLALLEEALKAAGANFVEDEAGYGVHLSNPRGKKRRAGSRKE